MENLPFWDDDDPEVGAAWDRCAIGGIVLPGIARVSCPTRREIDGKASPGSDGATFTDKGKAPAKVRVTLRIHTLAEWQVWLTARPSLDPQKNGGLKRPQTFDHPKASLAGVSSVYVTDIEEGDPDSSKGMEITIDCIEWMKQATPTNSKKEVSKADDFLSTVVFERGETQKVVEDPSDADNLSGVTFGNKTIKGLAP